MVNREVFVLSYSHLSSHLFQVGVVACQKVINPQVRHMLESHGVFVMQRLGSMYTDYLSVLSGIIMTINFFKELPR